MHDRPTPGPGQDSVWGDPRPPRVAPSGRRVRVIVDGVTLADTTRAVRVLETSPGTRLRDHLAFCPGRVDACFVDDERVQPQAGDFYGGWITSDVNGPFKGGPGTIGW